MEEARASLEETLKACQQNAPKAMGILEQGFEDALAILAFPEPYRLRLRTTNGMERLNREIRRRESVIQIFPNQASVIRLLGALLMEANESGMHKRFYMDMTEFHEWKKTKSKPEPTATE